MTPGDGILAGRFPLGQLVITRAAAGRLTPEEIADGIGRHARGAWGDISPGDAAENELALREGFRLLSAYGRGDRRFWVITEADRSVTTVLLPEDY
jgi:hypothetical protein